MLSLLVTVLVYGGAKRLYQRYRKIYLSPMLIGPLVLIVMLNAGRVSYASYMSTGGQWLNFLLGPATVALAIPMYKNLDLLKKHGLEIGVSVVLGSAAALFSSVLPALWMHLGPQVVNSLAPRSVTTPVAMDISRSVGGVPSITAAFVMITALTGLVVGPLVIHGLAIRTPVARGALFGMGAHGAGTARAFEFGSLEGTVASISMIAAAGVTLALMPLVPWLLTWRA
jgi:predicted murein hydrolase (TIGR00659 family)